MNKWQYPPGDLFMSFEVKSTGSKLAFIRVLRLGLDNFTRNREVKQFYVKNDEFSLS